jgi:H+-translocating NAD(P) transhydrogenase subunit beta
VPSASTLQTITQLSYLAAAALFILGLKRMSSPVTAVSGVRWAGLGMLLATLVTLAFIAGAPPINMILVLLAIAIGLGVAMVTGKRVAMTDMPQMIALYNGMGGGAAAAIAAVELYTGSETNLVHLTMATVGGFIGAVSFSGSLIAFAKLQGLITKSIRFGGQKFVNLAILLVTIAVGFCVVTGAGASSGLPFVTLFFAGALVLGVAMTLPIGGADMPVVISLLNSFTGVAVAITGFEINSTLLIICGALVGASGTLLTVAMSRAMNRPLTNVLFGAFGSAGGTEPAAGSDGPQQIRATSADDVAVMLAYASKVIFVPGYGMAVAQAQHSVKALADQLEKRGVKVLYAIHPVAGRMPGHMNVLLAEANVPYNQLLDMEDVNPEFPTADVALVIGANDVTNPAARSVASSPIYGMPILDVDKANNVVVLKRSMRSGFAGIENPLYELPNTSMLFGDAKASVDALTAAVKAL